MKITFLGATHEVTGSCYYLEGAGKKFVVMKLTALAKKNPLDCFGAIFRDAAKFFGYRLGRLTG